MYFQRSCGTARIFIIFLAGKSGPTLGGAKGGSSSAPGASACLPPIQIQPPSMGSVLDMLNIINGILFVQISQQDIDNIKGAAGSAPAIEAQPKE
jgi:hypothetical protein